MESIENLRESSYRLDSRLIDIVDKWMLVTSFESLCPTLTFKDRGDINGQNRLQHQYRSGQIR